MKHLKWFCIMGLCLGLSTEIFAYDFSACQVQAKKHTEKIGNTYGIALQPLNPKNGNTQPSKNVLFYYGRNAPANYKVLKHDPFLGMFLLESKTNLIPIELRPIESKILEEEVASLTPKEFVSGKIETRMQSPRKFATLNVPTFNNSLITTICEHFYGIGVGGGNFIEKHYIDRFVQSPVIYYGDLGIRVFDNPQNEVEVNLIDPFFENNPFRYGDIILSINGEAILNTDIFDRIVFDLPKHIQVPVKIRRNGVETEVNALVDSLRGGMLLPENFFSRVGIEISPDFTITAVSPEARNGFEQLKVGDKVLRINQREVPQGYNAIIRLLGDYPDEEQKWLISRNDFQFFLLINKKDKN